MASGSDAHMCLSVSGAVLFVCVCVCASFVRLSISTGEAAVPDFFVTIPDQHTNTNCD